MALLIASICVPESLIRTVIDFALAARPMEPMSTSSVPFRMTLVTLPLVALKLAFPANVQVSVKVPTSV